MKRKRRTRLLSLFLGLSLALSPAARALTPEQAGDLLDVYYIDDVPEEVLEQSTISGMLEALGDVQQLHVGHRAGGHRHLLPDYRGGPADSAGI